MLDFGLLMNMIQSWICIYPQLKPYSSQAEWTYR